MSKNKAPRKKKKPSRVHKNPIGFLNHLSVPEERINNLKKRADTELLRLYMRTGTINDVLSLFTTLQLGKAMLKYIENPTGFTTLFENAEKNLNCYDAQSEIVNLDDVRDALELCYQLWRMVNVNEFVAAAKSLRNDNPDIPQPKHVPL